MTRNHGNLQLALVAACALILSAQPQPSGPARLWHLRNLGKAFYENPTTQKDAVDLFRQALALAPDSPREQLNYGLALLRAGDTENGIAQLEKVQALDPKLPHTWFNLGVAYKRRGDFDRALAQFAGMTRLAPNEPVSHYQLGSLYKMKGDAAAATKQYEIARDLNPRLAAPHFQLYSEYRRSRPQDAAAELRIFQQLKKEQEGAAVPEDMEWCAYAEIYDPLDAPPSAPPAPLVYRSEKVADGFGRGRPGVAVLELDGGSRPSVIAWSPDRVAMFRNGVQPVADSGLEGLRDVVFIAPGDYDNDGLPDLCVITSKGAALYRNVGGKFRKEADLASGSFRKALWLDYDHDYDPDLFLLGDDSKLLRNNGQAGFSDETKRFPFAPGHAIDAVRFDLEPDTPGFDLVVSYEDRAGALYRDMLGGQYRAVPIPELPAKSAWLAAYDLNHDGRTDLAALPAVLLLNRPGGFERAPAPQATEFPFTATGPSALADFEGTGRTDRVLVAKDGAYYLQHDVTPNYGAWIEIALTGVKNPKLALGAEIEIKSGTFYEKQIYEGVPLVFRLGDRKIVDTVRITWPNGLIQNEPNQPVNRVDDIKEAPRLSGSCPMIFTWDGERFDFITDVLGVAPLGASSGEGQYFPVDHDEYVSIPGDKLKPPYDIRITEELREVSYLDQVKLIALDHPAGLDIVTNEKFKSPPFPGFRLFGISKRIYPASARDSHNADVLPAVLHRDRVSPSNFTRDQAGVAEMHHLDLDFGNAAPANHAVLILNGWVDWADGSTFLGATQEHKDLTFPYLQVKDAAGAWKTVIEDMGIPAGKPKTIAVDLTAKFLSASRQVRIVTNLCVYWDEIFLVEDAAPPSARLTTVRMAAADLHFRGFSRPAIDPRRQQPEMFDYQAVSFTSMWNPTPGNYTRYGPVANLLSEPDDRMVIMGSGDEIRLRFDAAGLPALPAGWKRDFLLLVDGWAKDADANTAFSQSVLPLPFHGMSRYPYPAGERYPSDAAHAAYLHDYLTRPALRLIRPLTGD